MFAVGGARTIQGTVRINKAREARTTWRLVVLASIVISVSAIALSQNISVNSDSSQVIQFLNQTIDWYRHVTAAQQVATEPDDLLAVSGNARMADEIVRLAFDFARTDVEVAAKQERSGLNQNQNPGSSHYSALLQMEAAVDKQVQQTQAEMESLQHKMEAATGEKRRELQMQIEEVQGELELAKARRDAIHNMAEFVAGAGTGGLGVTGLQAQIQALADSVPAASAASKSSEAALSSEEQPRPASIAAVNKPPSSGIWGLSADLLDLSQEIRTVDTAIQQTDAMATRSKEIRAPLVGRLKDLYSHGNELGKQADAANPSELAQEKQQLDALASQFKQLSAAVIPLSKQGILLGLYRKSLTNWESGLRSRRLVKLKGLLVRLAVLALILGLVIAAAELWRRAVYRYVHERRRRYQFLLLRKFVLWFLVAVIIAFAFASRLGSVVTFAGLITAGVAVALQNVILSIVGYFFLIGKFGIRVGDRVQIGGVTGEVIEIGLVRLHLMELGGSADYIPTGRVVAFSNSIVFQPTAGLFKQIPGTNFLWHEISLALSPDTEYSSAKERLLRVVEGVLADDREQMERQYQAIQTALISTSPDRFGPKVQIRFTPSAVEVVIRFPVDRQQAAEIDERVMHELLKELGRDPKLKLADSGDHSIRVTTDLAAA